MGNDKQIKVKQTGSVLEQARAEFLPLAIKDPERKVKQYSLEDEFSKSKKNKPWFLYLFVASFIVLIIVSAIILISVIQSKSRKIELNIRDFEDVKLKELIDSSKKGENQIDQFRRELSALDSDYKDEQERIGREFESKKDAVTMMDLPDADKTAKLSVVDKEEEKKRVASDRNYQSKRKEILAKISAEQSRIKDKGASGRTEKSFGDIFGGENKLFKIQMDKVADSYDKRITEEKEKTRKDKEDLVLLYNPLFKEKFILEVIQKPVPVVVSRSDFFAGLGDSLAVDNVLSKDQLSRLNDDMKKELALTGRLRQIPYKNSVQRAVMHSDSLTKSIFNTYDLALRRIVDLLDSKNLSLKYFNYALEYMTKSQQENGYILDARDNNAIGVYFGKVHKIRAGDHAFVFRSDDDYIATITFRMYKGVLVGSVTEIAKGRDIRPFDKIMFKMESGQK
jgi:hypothetical protein